MIDISGKEKCQVVNEYKKEVKTIVGDDDIVSSKVVIPINGAKNGNFTTQTISSIKPGRKIKIGSDKGYYAADPDNTVIEKDESNNLMKYNLNILDQQFSQQRSAWFSRVPQDLRPLPAFDYVLSNPDLPKVLLIGDSISIGYTPNVRQLLKSKANVYRAPTNCGSTDSGLENMTKWLGGKKWDVIHFNFGLHDMMYIDNKGQLDDSGRQVNSITKYKQNLEQITIQLKANAGKVLFATTTPVTEGTKGFKVDDPAKYNAAAIEVMKKNKIRVNDLHDMNAESLREYQAPDDVHFYEKGSEFLAQKVTLTIANALEKNN